MTAPMTEDNMGGQHRPAGHGRPSGQAQVEDVGGAISWEVVDGVACTSGDEAALPVPTRNPPTEIGAGVSDGDMEIRVDFTHREKAVEYRLLSSKTTHGLDLRFRGAEFGLDAEDAWRPFSAWLDES